jgi:hypothetical protein
MAVSFSNGGNSLFIMAVSFSNGGNSLYLSWQSVLVMEETLFIYHGSQF